MRMFAVSRQHDSDSFVIFPLDNIVNTTWLYDAIDKLDDRSFFDYALGGCLRDIQLDAPPSLAPTLNYDSSRKRHREFRGHFGGNI